MIDINAAEEYLNSDELGYFQDPCDLDVKDAFVAGAKFSLENQWHNAGDELPYQCPECFEKDEPNYTKDILCCSEEGVCYIDYMFKSRTSGEWNWSQKDLCNLKCWMSIPEIPEKLK